MINRLAANQPYYQPAINLCAVKNNFSSGSYGVLSVCPSVGNGAEHARKPIPERYHVTIGWLVLDAESNHRGQTLSPLHTQKAPLKTVSQRCIMPTRSLNFAAGQRLICVGFGALMAAPSYRR